MKLTGLCLKLKVFLFEIIVGEIVVESQHRTYIEKHRHGPRAQQISTAVVQASAAQGAGAVLGGCREAPIGTHRRGGGDDMKL